MDNIAFNKITSQDLTDLRRQIVELTAEMRMKNKIKLVEMNIINQDAIIDEVKENKNYCKYKGGFY
jgi:hypothetical protein